MPTQIKELAAYSCEEDPNEIAKAYNQVGERYRRYADGSLSKLFAFDGRYAFSDRQTWAVIEDCLHRLRLSGARRLRLLDLGCGPGTWLRRTVTRARQMGFTDISARGIDLSDSQIRWARMLSDPLASAKWIKIVYDVGDIGDGLLQEGDASADLCLCLYGVLNHVPVQDLSRILKEVARVTSRNFVATIRGVGSMPTIYVDGVASAKSFQQNNSLGRLDIEFQNGSRASFESHLFSCDQIRAAAADFMEIEDLRGLDFFHARFATDPRWNPPRAACSESFLRELEALESRYSHDPDFIDHATHLLLVARPQNTTERSRGDGA